MFSTTTHRSAWILAGLLTTMLLAGCAPRAVGNGVDDPTDAPVAAPDPDGGDDSDGGVVGERPPPSHDWDDRDREVSLSGGWWLRDCEGDAPLRCLHGPDESVRGVIELLRFEEHEGLIDAYDVDRANAALRELVADFDEWLLDDREVGCPQHTVEFEPTEFVSVDGAPAAIRGHRVLTPQGDPVERSLVGYIADGGDLVLVSVMATEPGGCTHVGELDELTPAELDHLHAELRDLLVHGSIPRG